MLRNKQVLIAAIAGLALQGYAAFALADDDEAKVVASGLLSPRGLDFAPNGQLYVVESGAQTTDTTSAPCIDAGMGAQCNTETGALTRVDPWGIHAPQQVASHLPTLGDVGPNDVSFFGMKAYVLIGLGTDPANRTILKDKGAGKADLLGTVLRVNSWNGKYDSVADISAVESSTLPNGPDGAFGGCCLDSNPFGISAGPGRLIVADAGGNDLIEVKANGQKKVLAVFPPEATATGLRDRVPSRVTLGPDGYLYVGEEAFGAGEDQARVYRVPPNGCHPVNECDVYADGFTNIMDLEFDRAGNLYVLEYGSGDLIKVDRRSHEPEPVYSGLKNPGGLALSPGGDFAFVSNKATCYGVETLGFTGDVECADGEYGEVLRIALESDRRHHHHHGKD